MNKKKNHDEAKKCYLYNKKFDDKKKFIKVRDHNHTTELYIGPAHSVCNLKRHPKDEIPVVFHIIIGYDSNLYWKR